MQTGAEASRAEMGLSGTHPERIRRAEEALNIPGSAGPDPWRPAWHFSARRGWINDPNGLIHYGGKCHLFYQHNPFAPHHGPMYWGHARSDDLVHWEHLPPALAPGEPYDLEGGCWSGSAVDCEGRLTVAYTGANLKASPPQSVCLARSQDGVVFEKDPDNPVIPGDPEGLSRDFRDPKVWRDGETWKILVGSSREERGCVLLFESPDLRNWLYRGVFAASEGNLGSMWECPDFFFLDGRHVLIISPIGLGHTKTLALIGSLQRGGANFRVESVQRIDYGLDFYAPQTFLDDKKRRIMIGWMGDWRTPDTPTGKYGWRWCLAAPRQIRLASDRERLVSEPAEEIGAVWGPAVHVSSLKPDKRGQIDLGELRGEVIELGISFEIKPRYENRLELHLRRSADGSRYTRVLYDAPQDTVTVDRQFSGSGPAGRVTMPARRHGTRVDLRLLLDRCSLEIFCGKPPTAAMSVLIYPRPGDVGMRAWISGQGMRILEIGCRGFRGGVENG